MEEILASIRRIIADDDIPKAPEPLQMSSEPAPAVHPVAAVPAPEQEPMYEASFESSMEQRFEDSEEEPQLEIVSSVDILELTEEMRAPEPQISRFGSAAARRDAVFAEMRSNPVPEAEPAMLSDHLEVARQALAEQMEQPLLSNTASVAVDNAFTSLAHTVLSQNARTLDDLVKDMLRPMLKAWLDDNLPGMVERLVRAEIERVSRGH